MDMQSLQRSLSRTQARLSGQLSGSLLLSEIMGHALLGSAILRPTDRPQRLDALLNACRRLRSRGSRRLLGHCLKRYLVGAQRDLSRKRKVGWDRYDGTGESAHQRALSTSLLLKAPKPPLEKGVLYCSFEYNWLWLVAKSDAAAVLKDYYLVGATSWSPTDYAAISAFAGLSADPIFVGISNECDLRDLALMRPVAEPLGLLASDWINSDVYLPKPHRSRTIDILMVANYSRFKRHWLLFEALHDMPRSLHVVLVGRDAPGRTRKEILDEAAAFGVKQDLEIHTNLEIDEVARLQEDARTSAIFSRREGSCVATAESLFADSPVAMMEEAHIGSKSYINRKTGVLLRRQGLAKSLERFLDESEGYEARKWATENISCWKSSRLLNQTLREWSLKTGRPWTEDIAPLCWRYVPCYVNPSDEERLLPAVHALADKHGVALQKFSGERASLLMQKGASVVERQDKPALAQAPVPVPIAMPPRAVQAAPGGTGRASTTKPPIQPMAADPGHGD